MSPELTTPETIDREFDEMVSSLTCVLEQLHKATHRLTEIVRDRLNALVENDEDRFEHCMEIEREALADFVLVERERVACLVEIGQTLSHRDPSRLRVAELVLYVRPEQRDALLDVRERLRDVADELDVMVAASPLFRRHHSGRMTLFIDHDVATPPLFRGESAEETQGVDSDTVTTFEYDSAIDFDSAVSTSAQGLSDDLAAAFESSGDLESLDFLVASAESLGCFDSEPTESELAEIEARELDRELEQEFAEDFSEYLATPSFKPLTDAVPDHLPDEL